MPVVKCSLRKWRLSDAKDLARLLSNRRILNNLRDGLPYPYTEQDAADYITAMLAAPESDTFAYAITAEDKVIGSIGAFRQDNIHARSAELGYYLDESYWGHGIITDAIRQLCDRLFQTTDLLRIYAEPFSYNIGSCRALEKAGFQYEGTLKNYAFKNTRVQDMKLYAMTRGTEPYTIRRLGPEELPAACALAWEVFCQFEAPEYAPEGIAEFRRTLDDREVIRRMYVYGAFAGDTLVGMLAMRGTCHISLFFVKRDWHRKGVGRRLFEAMAQDFGPLEFTVHSSPYAVEIYRRLGFAATATEQVSNGIRYIPMRFTP